MLPNATASTPLMFSTNNSMGTEIDRITRSLTEDTGKKQTFQGLKTTDNTHTLGCLPDSHRFDLGYTASPLPHVLLSIERTHSLKNTFLYRFPVSSHPCVMLATAPFHNRLALDSHKTSFARYRLKAPEEELHSNTDIRQGIN